VKRCGFGVYFATCEEQWEKCDVTVDDLKRISMAKAYGVVSEGGLEHEVVHSEADVSREVEESERLDVARSHCIWE
jgi:hypothetical protein